MAAGRAMRDAAVVRFARRAIAALQRGEIHAPRRPSAACSRRTHSGSRISLGHAGRSGAAARNRRHAPQAGLTPPATFQIPRAPPRLARTRAVCRCVPRHAPHLSRAGPPPRTSRRGPARSSHGSQSTSAPRPGLRPTPSPAAARFRRACCGHVGSISSNLSARTSPVLLAPPPAHTVSRCPPPPWLPRKVVSPGPMLRSAPP